MLRQLAARSYGRSRDTPMVEHPFAYNRSPRNPMGSHNPRASMAPLHGRHRSSPWRSGPTTTLHAALRRSFTAPKRRAG
eukprot:4323145-Prymnesium_polylepis.1